MFLIFYFAIDVSLANFVNFKCFSLVFFIFAFPWSFSMFFVIWMVFGMNCVFVAAWYLFFYMDNKLDIFMRMVGNN